MATLIRPDNTSLEFTLPDNPSLEYLQGLVGGTIEFVTFRDGSAVMVDEEGLLKQKVPNDSATGLCALKGYFQSFPIAGVAVFFSRAEMEKMEAEDEDDDDPSEKKP